MGPIFFSISKINSSNELSSIALISDPDADPPLLVILLINLSSPSSSVLLQRYEW